MFYGALLTLFLTTRSFYTKPYLNNFTKKKMIDNDDEYYNFTRPISYDLVEPLYKFTTILEKKNYNVNEKEPRRVYTDDDFIKDIKENLQKKYGAYRDPNEVTDDMKKMKGKKAKKRKEKDEKEYMKREMKKINDENQKRNEKEEKPLVFLVDPKQLDLYKYYNKTMNAAKEARNNPPVENSEKNKTLPKGWNDDEYYIFF